MTVNWQNQVHSPFLIKTQKPNNFIFNYSFHKLSHVEKNVLVSGLNFALPPVKLSYVDYLTL